MQRGGKVHRLKIMPEFYQAVIDGRKTFELRRNDRDFSIGDVLILCEWDGEEFTGREYRCHVGYVLEGYDGLQPGYAILGIASARLMYMKDCGAEVTPNFERDIGTGYSITSPSS